MNGNALRAMLIAGASAAALLTPSATSRAEVSNVTIDDTTGIFQIFERDMTTIRFAPGSSTLSANDRQALTTMAADLKGDPNVAKLVVAAWSDKEYPAGPDQRLSSADRSLAEDRAKHVKDVLVDSGARSVSTYSMAEHPSWLARTFNTAQAKLKGDGRIKSSQDHVIADLGRQIRNHGGPNDVVVIVQHKSDNVAH